MAQQAPLILGVAAAVGGSFIGIPPTVGFALGSLAGSLAFPPKGPHTNGPKLSDTTSQISSYGAAIPRLHGQCGLAANLIWTTPLIPTTYDVSAPGGKGGGGGATQTNTSYTCSFALHLADSLDGGLYYLSRIWIQGKCYYDVRDSATVEALQSSSLFAKFMTFYPGSSTQMPDPTMEAVEGAGHVPAYLDQAYVVFTDLPMGPYNNAPPGALQMSFELTHSGTSATGIRQIGPRHAGFGCPSAASAFGETVIFPVINSTIHVGGGDLSYGVNVYSLGGTLLGNEAPSADDLAWPSFARFYDAVHGTKAVTKFVDNTRVRASPSGALFSSGNVYISAEVPSGGTRSAIGLFPSGEYYRSCLPCADLMHIFVTTSASSGVPASKWYLLGWDGNNFTLDGTGTVTTSPSFIDFAVGPGGQSGYYSGCVESDLKHVWTVSGVGGTVSVWEIDATGLLSQLYTLTPDPYSFVPNAVWADAGLAHVFFSNYLYTLARTPGAAVSTETVGDAMLAEMKLAGLAPAQINVTALAATPLGGIKISSVGPTRTFIEALAPAYWFDLVPSGGVLKAVLRGGASCVTIPQGDLCATAGGGAANGSPVDSKRTDPRNIVGQVVVNYMSRAADYQLLAAADGREATFNTPSQSIDLPLVLDDGYAKQVATVNLYNQVVGNSERTFSLPRKYAYLEPPDVVTLDLPEGQLVIRITSVQQSGGVLIIKGVDEQPALYVPSGPSYSVDRGQSVAAPSPSFVALMNIPALSSNDNDAGFYAAACGYPGLDWSGTSILESRDNGVSFSGTVFIKNAGTMGPVTGVLGNYAGSLAVYDTGNTLRVNFYNGVPLTVSDADIAAGANKMAVGIESGVWEEIQFKTVMLVSGTTYDLSNLMRGVNNTSANIATHVGGEKAVLLDAAVVRVPSDEGSIHAPRNYKSVTSGSPTSSATSVPFANAGSGLTPTSAAAITFDPTGLQNVTALNVQAAIAQLDALPNFLDVKASVRAATTANITLSGAQTIDGVAVVAGNRVLVKNQSTAANNGIYVAAAGAWARAADANVSAEVTAGMFTFVSEGTTNADTGWVLTTDDAITLGTTALGFAQFTGAGGVGSVTGGSGGTTGLTLTGTTTLTLGGVLVPANGGTGLSSYAVGDMLYASAGAVLSKLAAVAVGFALISGGVTTAPAWGKVALTTHVSGVLPVANGGTGTAAPGLVAGTNVTITGTWPNQTINASAGGGGGTPGGSNGQLEWNNAGAFGGITNVTSNGTDLTALGLAGNQTFTGSSRFLLAPMSTGNSSTDFVLKTSVVNGATLLQVTPDGTGTTAGVRYYNLNNPAGNAAYLQLAITSTAAFIDSTRALSGTAVPLQIRMGNATTVAATFQTNGNVTLGTTTTDPGVKLLIEGVQYIKATSASSGFSLADRATAAGRQFVFKGLDTTSPYGTVVNIWHSGATQASPLSSAFSLWNADIDLAANGTQFQVSNNATYDGVLFTQAFGTGTAKKISLQAAWGQASIPTQLVLTTTGHVLTGGSTETSGAQQLQVTGYAYHSLSMGIATEPATTHSGQAALEVGNGATFQGSTSSARAYVTSNLRFLTTTNWTYKTTAVGSVLQTDVDLVYYTTPSGTAGTNAPLTQRLKIDGTNGYFLLGAATAGRSTATITAALEVEGLDAPTSSHSQICNSAAAASTAPGFVLARSRGAAIGAVTAVTNTDRLGAIYWAGANGTNLDGVAASISGWVDGSGTVSSSSMPGKIVFATTPNGSNVPNEVMRLDSFGKMLLNANNTARTINSNLARIQSEAVTYSDSSMSLICDSSTGTDCAFLNLAKSNGGTIGSNTAVASGSRLGAIYFYGADGSNMNTAGGAIEVRVDGAVSSGNVPGRMIFYVCSGGAITEVARFDSNQNLLLNGMTPGTSAAKVLAMANATAPSSSPAGGGQQWVEAGALKYRGSSGTVTTLAPA